MNAPIDFDPMEARLPPHHAESEQSVLGGLLMDNTAMDRIDLAESDFYAHDHRLIWKAITGLIEAGKPADVITVAESLDAAGELDRVGGLSYVAALSSNTPSAANVRSYAKTVKNRATLRRLAEAGTRIADMAYAGGDAAESVAQAQQAVMELDTTEAAQESMSLRDALRMMVERVDAAFHGTAQSVHTGFTDLDAKIVGLEPGDVIVVAGRPSMGKAQPLDAEVLMADGQWSRMGDLSVGDALASIDDEPSIVTGVFPQGRKQVLRVTFSDGRSTECCAEHLWSVSHRKWAQPKVMQTAEIADLMKRPGMRGRLWVGPLSGDFGSDAQLPVDPWLLGALLGDGDFTQSTVRFSKTAAETIDRVRSALPETVEMVAAGGCDYRLSVPRSGGRTNPLMESIRALGLAGCVSANKFIPQIYMSASRDDRLNLLRGLLDTDGWVEKTGSVLYSTASQRMAIDVQSLARSLGYWCSINTTPAHYTHNGERLRGLDQHRLVLSGAGLDNLFLFEAKRARCANRTKQKRIAFESIDPAGEAVCQCISVSHPSRLYVTDDYIVTHNTAFAMQIAEAVSETGPVQVFSLEMNAQQLSMRMAAGVGKIDLMKLRTGQLNDDEWRRLTYALGKLNGRPMYIDDRSSMSVAQIRARARQTKRKHGLGLIVIDYIGLVDAPGENRAAAVGAVSRSIKAMARELGVPVIMLCQLNRQVTGRANHRPVLSDLRESGAIEQDADLILLLHRDDYYNPDSQWKGVAECIIGKQRNGPTGIVPLAFNAESARFGDFAGRYEPDEARPARKGFE